MTKKYSPTLVAASKPTEAHQILIHGPIGKSFWSDDGISGKEVIDLITGIPVGQNIVLGVNSQGGSVGEGLAIFNAIKRRSADISVRIDGYALSIASVFPLAASKILSPKTSIWMIHRAWSGASGNTNDMRKAADMLEQHDEVIAGIYAERTGKTPEEIKEAMDEETWFTGSEAIAWKLADEEGEDETTKPAEPLDFGSVEPQSAFRNAPANVWNTFTQASLPKVISALQIENTRLRQQLANPKAAGTKEAERLLKVVAEQRMPAAQAMKWLPKVLADASLLDHLEQWPQMPEAAEDVGGGADERAKTPSALERANAEHLAQLRKRTSNRR